MVREGALDRAALFFNVLVFQANLTKQTEINQRNQINQKDASTLLRIHPLNFEVLLNVLDILHFTFHRSEKLKRPDRPNRPN